MTRTEDRLTDALQAIADGVREEMLRPLTVPEHPRRQWAVRLAPAAAAAVVALIAVVTLAVPGGTGSLSGGHRLAAYVTSVGSRAGLVTAINLSTGKAAPAIEIGVMPSNVSITPNGKTAYVLSERNRAGEVTPISGEVTPISIATNTPGKPIKAGTDPVAIAITPNGKTAYVANTGHGPGSPGTVTPIDTATNTAGPAIRVGSEPTFITITPDGKTAYVSGNSTVTLINTATNTPGKPIHVGYNPYNIVITPTGKTAYVVVSESGIVIPINTATSTPGKPIKVAGHVPDRILMTPNGLTLYVMDGLPTLRGRRSYVTVISTATNHVVKVIRMDPFLFGMAATPDGKTVYVAGAGRLGTSGGSVIPISTATNTAGNPIDIRGRPVAIAITP